MRIIVGGSGWQDSWIKGISSCSYSFAVIKRVKRRRMTTHKKTQRRQMAPGKYRKRRNCAASLKFKQPQENSASPHSRYIWIRASRWRTCLLFAASSQLSAKATFGVRGPTSLVLPALSPPSFFSAPSQIASCNRNALYLLPTSSNSNHTEGTYTKLWLNRK